MAGKDVSYLEGTRLGKLPKIPGPGTYTGGAIATGGVTSPGPVMLLGGTWNVAGGIVTRFLDDDPSSGAGHLGSLTTDAILGVVGARIGIGVEKRLAEHEVIGPLLRKFLGGGAPRAASFATSTVFPPAAQNAINEAVDYMLENNMLIMGPNVSAKDPSVNCHLAPATSIAHTSTISTMDYIFASH